jgi:hypothetical protein
MAIGTSGSRANGPGTVETVVRYSPCSPDDWWKLPLKLRIRWWDETDYSRNEPSPELMEEIQKCLQSQKKN